MAEQKLTFVLDAVAQTAGIKQMVDGFKKLSDGVTSANKTLDNLLGGITRSLGPIGGIVTAVTGAAAATLGFRAALNELDSQDHLGNLASKAGAAVEVMKQFSVAAALDGVGLEDLASGFKTYAKWLEDTDQKTGDLLGSLLGLADQVAAMPDGMEKLNLVTDRLGKSGQNWIPFLNKGSAGLRELLAEANRVNPVTAQMSENANNFNKVLFLTQEAAKGLTGELAQQLIPTALKFLQTIQDILVALREFIHDNPFIVKAIQYMTAALAAFAGFAVAGRLWGWLNAITGGITTVREFGAALSLVGQHAAAIGLPQMALAFVGVATAIATATEAIKAWNAAKQEAATNDSLQQGVSRLKFSLDSTLSAEEREALRKKLAAADDAAQQMYRSGQNPIARLFNPFDAQNELGARLRAQMEVLNEFAKKGRQIAEQHEKPEDRFGLTDDQRAAFQKRIRLITQDQEYQAASNAAEVESNQQSYNRKTETIEEFYIRQKKLTEQSYEDERKSDFKKLEVWREILDSTANLSETASKEQRERAKRDGEEAEKQIEQLNNKRLTEELKYRAKLAELDKQARYKNSFIDQTTASLNALRDEMGTLAENAGKLVASPLRGLFDGLKSSITGLIEGTMTWGDALRNIADSVLKAIIEAFAQMVASWLVSQIAMTGIQSVWSGIRSLIGWGETGQKVAQDTTKVASHTAAEGAMTSATLLGQAMRLPGTIIEAGKWLVTTAFKAASAVADIPFVGPVLAIAAMAAIIGAGVKYMGGFEEGGVVHGPRQVITVNESGKEAVLNARATGMLGEHTINALNSGAMSVRNLGLKLAGGGSIAGTSPDALNAALHGIGTIEDRIGTSISGTTSRPSQAAPSMAPQAARQQPGQMPNFLFVDKRGGSMARDYLEKHAGRAHILEIHRQEAIPGGYRT